MILKKALSISLPFYTRKKLKGKEFNKAVVVLRKRYKQLSANASNNDKKIVIKLHLER